MRSKRHTMMNKWINKWIGMNKRMKEGKKVDNEHEIKTCLRRRKNHVPSGRSSSLYRQILDSSTQIQGRNPWSTCPDTCCCEFEVCVVSFEVVTQCECRGLTPRKHNQWVNKESVKVCELSSFSTENANVKFDSSLFAPSRLWWKL